MNRWDLNWLKANRPLLIAQIVGTALVVTWLLIAYIQTRALFPLLLVFLLPVFWVLNLLNINRGRARQADPANRRDIPTGTLLTTEAHPFYAPGSASRWVGAADMPTNLGRMNASTPLAVLELNEFSLTLRVRPRFLSGLFGIGPLRVIPADVEAIFPAKARLRYPAICIRPCGMPPSYFLTKDREWILTALAAAGFPVHWEERAYSPA